jgi:chloramphenicol O-acetyltransferase
MAWLYETEQLICYDKINPTQYVFHEDTETITVAYTEYEEDYHIFYENGVVKMPVSVRLNHAVADGYSVARVFTLIEEEIKRLVL